MGSKHFSKEGLTSGEYVMLLHTTNEPPGANVMDEEMTTNRLPPCPTCCRLTAVIAIA